MAFVKGTINSKGRPKGTGYRQILMNERVLPHKEELVDKIVAMAMDGNEQMLKILSERLLPAKAKEEPIRFNIPDCDLNNAEAVIAIGLSVIKSLSEGELLPDEAHKIASVLAVYSKAIVDLEINERLTKLETADKEKKNV